MPINPAATQTGPNVIQSQRTIWNGTPGDKFVNDTAKALYQFICTFVPTRAGCASSTTWRSALRGLFRYISTVDAAGPINPGDEATHAFVDFRQIIDDMKPAQQVAAVGAPISS